MRKNLFLLSVVILSSYFVDAANNNNSSLYTQRISTSFSKSTKDSDIVNKKPQDLKIFAKPNSDAKVIASIPANEGFEVKQGDWVKVSSLDGKKSGWAKASSVNDNINTSWQMQYEINIDGPNDNYKVTKVSPKERQERYKKAQKEARENLRKFRNMQNAFFQDPFFSSYDNELDQEEIANLQKQVKDLQKQVKNIEQKK